MYVPNTSRGESPFPTSHSEAASFRGCVVSPSHGDTRRGLRSLRLKSVRNRKGQVVRRVQVCVL